MTTSYSMVMPILLFFSCSAVSDSFVTPWTVDCQAPLTMGFPRQKYWSGLPYPSSGDLPDPGIKPISPASQEDSLLLSHQGSPMPILQMRKTEVLSGPGTQSEQGAKKDLTLYLLLWQHWGRSPPSYNDTQFLMDANFLDYQARLLSNQDWQSPKQPAPSISARIIFLMVLITKEKV